VKKKQVPRLNLHNCSYQELIEVLGRAKTFVSGRWHASIMASLSGTPVVLWGSDSHKTKALTVMYDYPFQFYNMHTLPLHIDDLCADVERAFNNESELRKNNMKQTILLRDEAKKNIRPLELFRNGAL
jgi:polysaccharide pyruvyl transferase WcaK-like protein